MDYKVISEIVERGFGDVHPIIKAHEKYFLMMSFLPEIKVSQDENMPVGKICYLDF